MIFPDPIDNVVDNLGDHNISKSFDIELKMMDIIA